MIMPTTATDKFGEVARHGSNWTRALPFVILALAGGVLRLKWDSIPDRWPIHWGANGQPNGWATRTIAGVFLPLAVGFLICLFLEVIASVIKASGKRRRGMSPEAAIAVAKLTADLLRLLEIALAIASGFLALSMPLVESADPVRMAWFVFAVVGAAIVVGTIRLWIGVRELKRGGNKGLEGYNGIIYNNPDDPRLWVPKISGLGYTLNFAHPWARPIMIVILVVVILIFALGVMPGLRQSVAR